MANPLKKADRSEARVPTKANPVKRINLVRQNGEETIGICGDTRVSPGHRKNAITPGSAPTGGEPGWS
jgi:hypothetical protein